MRGRTKHVPFEEAEWWWVPAQQVLPGEEHCRHTYPPGCSHTEERREVVGLLVYVQHVRLEFSNQPTQGGPVEQVEVSVPAQRLNPHRVPFAGRGFELETASTWFLPRWRNDGEQ